MKQRGSEAPESVVHEPPTCRDGTESDAGTESETEGSLFSDEARQPLSRKIPIPSSRINPYRMVIIMRLAVVGFFFYYRLKNPVHDAYTLWLVSVVCEIWFAMSWILEQFPKWQPINRNTYGERLALRYNRIGEPSQLAAVDLVVTTNDPLIEPPLVTANTVLSVLAVDYPVEKVSCYVSDDGAAILTFETLQETSEFARKWVPFCKKYSIEPRAPEQYFLCNVDYLKNKIHPSFVKERRVMKSEYEEFKVRINGLVAKARKVPDEGWVMKDGTPWPGNNVRDHPGMIQDANQYIHDLRRTCNGSENSFEPADNSCHHVFLGHNGGHDADGNELPQLIYVSREKRPGFRHHNKAGALNALVRVSGILTNGPFLLNLNFDHYVNNSKALQEAMCFLMDPNYAESVCYVQFPLRFNGVDENDRYANRNTIFFDINLRGLDGIQGPLYVGTGCVFNRRAVYGYEAPRKIKLRKQGILSMCFGGSRGDRSTAKKKISSKNAEPNAPTVDLEHPQEATEGDGYEDEKLQLMSHLSLEKWYGQSYGFIESILIETGDVSQFASPETLLKEAIQVISCGYEDNTKWGSEIGWIYGSASEEFVTGLKMHARGWRSIYCMPKHAAFKGYAPTNLSDRLNQVLRWAQGSVQVLLSRHCPIWYGFGGRLKLLQRLAYINATVYPFTAIPLLAYCTLPAVCLFTGKFIIPQINIIGMISFISLSLSIIATNILEMRWSGVRIDEWWSTEQFWVIGGVSAHLFAIFQGLLKVLTRIDVSIHHTPSKEANEKTDFTELYIFKWTSLLIPPTTLLLINLIGLVAGISSAISSGHHVWSVLFCKLFFAFWVIIHLYPFLKGLTSNQSRVPTIVLVWSILLASIFSLLWVHINPFTTRVVGPSIEQCGINC